MTVMTDINVGNRPGNKIAIPLLLYSSIQIMVYMVKREPTSINVDPELWKDAKIEAIKRGITVTDLFEQSLRKEIKGANHK